MKLICGLGNPGKKYENNRHNAGFFALQKFAKKINAPDFQKKPKWKGEVSQIDDLLLFRPLTFMNNSGQAIAEIGGFYKISPADIWIIYDDVDLPLGEIRIRESGGAGTHNGMKSVIQYLNTEDFPRIRIGIESRGKEGSLPTEADLHDFVLSDFLPEERKIFEKSVEEVCEFLLANRK